MVINFIITIGGVCLSSIKHLYSNKKSSTYTLMIIPGKYGISKSLIIPRWLILASFSILLCIVTVLTLFFSNYSTVKKQNTKNIKDMEILKQQNITQKQELKSYEDIEEELLNKLEKLKEIEDKLKKRLNSNSETKTSIAMVITSSHLNLQEVDEHINSLYSMIDDYDKKMSEEKRIPHILPCFGRISSYFGTRTNPVSRGRSEVHHGIDITNSYKTPIKASADGIVEYAGWLSGYGYAVIINHQNGYESLYGHNSKLLVKKNQSVKRGQTISLMGSTGRSTGTHVHFEVRLNGNPINPLKITKGGNL